MDVRDSPRVVAMRVIPVAGRDSMLLNLSGAHAPFFIRNLVVITDSSGRVGVAVGKGAAMEPHHDRALRCCVATRGPDVDRQAVLGFR